MILVLVAALILIPIGFAVLGGFKSNGQLVGDPGAIIPSPWVLSNYTDVLFGPNSGVFWREVLNSLIVAVIAVTATVDDGQRLREELLRDNAKPQEFPATLCFSIGTALADSGAALVEALRLADARMYADKRARRAGRDCDVPPSA